MVRKLEVKMIDFFKDLYLQQNENAIKNMRFENGTFSQYSNIKYYNL